MAKSSWWRSPKPIIFAICLLPLADLIYLSLTDQLGANPPQTLVQRLGLWALRFLILALAITPVRRLTGWNVLARYRRMIGLFAFFYVSLHLISYIVADQSLDIPAIIKDILKRPFITVGMAAFILLIPLVVTSTTAMQRRLGGRRWQKLHRLVYVVGVLGAVHYIMLVKSWPLQPLVYAVIVALLLLYRLGVYLRKKAPLPRPASV